MKHDKKIQYVDGFKFSFVLPLNEMFRYEIVIKTTGLNQYVAGFEHKYNDWFCNRCAVHGDEVTVFVKDHNLQPGKVICFVNIYDRHDREVESVTIDPHILLVYDYVRDENRPNDVEMQQSIDIVKIYDKIGRMKEQIASVEDQVDHKTSVKDEFGKSITKMWITTDDEGNEPIYTKAQIHERFVSKKDAEKFADAKAVKDALKHKVDNKELVKHYYNKSEADNIFAKYDRHYTKEEVDSLFGKVKKNIDKINESIDEMSGKIHNLEVKVQALENA